jgi:hypothetical protein
MGGNVKAPHLVDLILLWQALTFHRDADPFLLGALGAKLLRRYVRVQMQDEQALPLEVYIATSNRPAPPSVSTAWKPSPTRFTL